MAVETLSRRYADIRQKSLTQKLTTDLHSQAEICLERILISPIFSGARRQQTLLRYLAKHMFSGDAERLKGYVIGIEVFGRGNDFDPATDAIVRVEAGRLRARLRDYYAGVGRDDPMRFELSKGRYLLSYRVNDGKSGSGASPENGSENIESAIAVLPLVDLSDEAARGHFADGITDALIHELSRLTGIRIVSRQSSYAFRGSSKSARQIADALGAKHLLQGSVQRIDQRVRVMVQLVDAVQDRQVWSERFDSNVQDIFALQDELTRDIVRAYELQIRRQSDALPEFHGGFPHYIKTEA